MANLITYIPTEAELRQLVGGQWPDKLIRDYLTIKYNSDNVNGEVVDVTAEVVALKIRVTTAEGEINTLQVDLTALTTATNNHIAAQSAHGATGDIVGTNDYCTASVGGTVLLAAAQANATASAVTPPTALGASSATYVQAEQQAQTDAVNALINNINTLKSDLNTLVTVVNNMLATERTAKQRAT